MLKLRQELADARAAAAAASPKGSATTRLIPHVLTCCSSSPCPCASCPCLLCLNVLFSSETTVRVQELEQELCAKQEESQMMAQKIREFQNKAVRACVFLVFLKHSLCKW